MAEVDFYVVTEPGEPARLRVACRLAEKAWSQGHRVYVHTGGDEETTRIDDLLWTFRQDSFVPHERWRGADDEPAAPVMVGDVDARPAGTDVLINLSARVPAWFGGCARVADLVGGDEQARALGRERYRAYRAAGATLRSHEV